MDSSKVHTSTTDDSIANQLSNSVQSIPRAYTEGFWPVTNNGELFGMIAAACVLLLFYALLAGLTLAVCGLDLTWLHMRLITGTSKQRNRVRVVTKLKRNSTWMLCSLIICSVAAGEIFPFIIQDLWHGQQLWAPIVVSTLLVAIFAEILPQYIIPRHAISWGYFCSPLIWGCMVITGIISYPLALLLDALTRKKEDQEIFTNTELAALIKYHDHSEKHGGEVGEDANRIMLGALELNSRKVGSELPIMLEKATEEDTDMEKDVEKANPNLASSMIVQWSAVKTIDIDEVVDSKFIRKVKSWSYSRIPVIGGRDENPDAKTSWEGKHIYGFLHIKNLLGLVNEKHDLETSIFVRDLPLYPLPIIQENMSVYELLNIFQLGMSRMAVVISNPPSPSIEASPRSCNLSSQLGTPQWTATQRTNARITNRMKTADSQIDWTTDWAANFLKASQMDIQKQGTLRGSVIGFVSSAPIGIITFEDIIDTVFQKPSREERDFFGGDHSLPLSLPLSLDIKAGDLLTQPTRPEKSFGGLHPFKDVIQDPFQESPTKCIRRKSVSKLHDVVNGTNSVGDLSVKRFDFQDLDYNALFNDPEDCKLSDQEVECHKPSIAGLDGADERNEHLGSNVVIPPRRGSNRASSSYTEDSQGGFHVSRRIPWRNQKLSRTEEGQIAMLTANIDLPPKVGSLPSHRGLSSLLFESVETLGRNASAMSALKSPQRATTSENEHFSGVEASTIDLKDSSDLILPKAPVSDGQNRLVSTDHKVRYDASGIDIDENHSWDREEAESHHTCDETGSTISLSSWNYADLLAAQDPPQRSRNTSMVKPPPTRLSSVTFPITTTPQAELLSISATSLRDIQESPPKFEDVKEDYRGFPSELLGSINLKREKAAPDYASKTLPRMVGLTAKSGEYEVEQVDTYEVKMCYDADGQPNALEDAFNMDGTRSSSFWL